MIYSARSIKILLFQNEKNEFWNSIQTLQSNMNGIWKQCIINASFMNLTLNYKQLDNRSISLCYFCSIIGVLVCLSMHSSLCENIYWTIDILRIELEIYLLSIYIHCVLTFKTFARIPKVTRFTNTFLFCWMAGRVRVNSFTLVSKTTTIAYLTL